uniref:Lipoprotein n=1 Tax=Desulfovibrio sp. U5L TaxID=596152 RepID=I2Q5N4_9BACT
MQRTIALVLAAFAALASLAACAPVATGELERLYNRENNDRLTQIEGRQDFRTFRQKTPSFLLP